MRRKSNKSKARSKSNRMLPFVAATPWSIVRFGLGFLVALAVMNAFLESNFAWGLFRRSYCVALSSVCGSALSPFISGVRAVGDRIYTDGFEIRIVRDCDALNAASIVVAGLLAFPSRLKAKAIGLALGLPVLFVLNAARVSLLFAIGVASVRLFEFVHVYLFQAFIIAAAVGYFLCWALEATQGRLARPSGSPVRP